MKENANLFFEAGADPNIRNKDNKTPLDLAVESGIGEAVEFLRARQ